MKENCTYIFTPHAPDIDMKDLFNTVPWSDILILHTTTSQEVAGWKNLCLPWTKI